MKNNFQLIKTHPKVAFFDDDKSACEAMALSMSNLFPSEAFATAVIAQKVLKTENEKLQKEERKIASFLAQESPTQVLKSAYEWLHKRSPILEVCFCDYDLGYSTGVHILQSIGDSLIRRIIITGVATDDIAVKAFNDGYIEGFLKKNRSAQKSDIEKICKLGAKRSNLVQSTNDNYDPLEFLKDRNVAQSLSQLINEVGGQDYILLARPLGVLAKTKTGAMKWIHLECEESLKDTLGYLETESFSQNLIREVAAGELGACPDLSNAFPGVFPNCPTVEMKELSEAPWLIAGVIDLPESCSKEEK